jgi:addiction module HigA family antidote
MARSAIHPADQRAEELKALDLTGAELARQLRVPTTASWDPEWPARLVGGEPEMARIPIHPGDHLAEELRALEMSAAELARQLEVPTNRVTGILNGQRAITGDTALRLGHFFGTSPQFWLNLQMLYDLRVAEQRTGRTIKALPRLKRARGMPEVR